MTNTLPTILVGRARGRLTRRIAALESVVLGSHLATDSDSLTTRTPRGVFSRPRARSTGFSTNTAPQIARWL